VGSSPSTANVYERVLELESEIDRGTAFTIDTGKRQYLVTAAHLVPPARDITVTVSNRFGSRQLLLRRLVGLPAAADIVVAPLPEPVTPDLPLPATLDGLIYSQDLFFLGYPSGLAMVIGSGSAGRMPLVKKAILSASEEIDGCHVLYLDGHNNRGFSGGPVVGFNQRQSQMQVCGVVHRFRTEEVRVEDHRSQAAELSASVNAGIVVATNIRHVTEAINRFEINA